MAAAPLPIRLAHDPETGLPIAPSSKVWASLTRAEQDRVTEALMAALAAHQQTLPPEGTPHGEAQRDALDRFRRHFDRTRRGVFLAANLMVQYPDEPTFAPDLLAVLDVALHHRMSWVVDREGKGPDFVLEVLFSGDEKKDLHTNVARYSRLGIPEYFVFDGRRRRISGWHLAEDATRRYVPVVPQGGRYASAVLGVELAVEAGALKLYKNGAPVLGTSEENALLARTLDEALAALDVEAERADQEAERARQEAERARQEAERARQEAERADAAVAALRATFRGALAARGWATDADLEARLDACRDPQRLAEWIARALRAASRDDLALE